MSLLSHLINVVHPKSINFFKKNLIDPIFVYSSICMYLLVCIFYLFIYFYLK